MTTNTYQRHSYSDMSHSSNDFEFHLQKTSRLCILSRPGTSIQHIAVVHCNRDGLKTASYIVNHRNKPNIYIDEILKNHVPWLTVHNVPFIGSPNVLFLKECSLFQQKMFSRLRTLKHALVSSFLHFKPILNFY